MKNHFDSIESVNNLREIQALQRLSPHPNIINLYEVLYDKPTGRLALVFELMDMNIYEMIWGRRHYLPEKRIKSYTEQLLMAIDHMHRNGIFHRDIKPENILIKGDLVKLADFGSCRGVYSRQPYTEYISTRWYRAPECLLTDGYYGHKMDLWGVGCVMFEVIALFPLFPGENELDQLQKIHKVMGNPGARTLAKIRHKATHIDFNFAPQQGTGLRKLIPHVSKDCATLIERMLSYDVEQRISAKKSLQSPWFRDLRQQREAASKSGGASEGSPAGSTGRVRENASSKHAADAGAERAARRKERKAKKRARQQQQQQAGAAAATASGASGGGAQKGKGAVSAALASLQAASAAQAGSSGAEAAAAQREVDARAAKEQRRQQKKKKKKAERNAAEQAALAAQQSQSQSYHKSQSQLPSIEGGGSSTLGSGIVRHGAQRQQQQQQQQSSPHQGGSSAAYKADKGLTSSLRAAGGGGSDLPPVHGNRKGDKSGYKSGGGYVKQHGSSHRSTHRATQNYKSNSHTKSNYASTHRTTERQPRERRRHGEERRGGGNVANGGHGGGKSSGVSGLSVGGHHATMAKHQSSSHHRASSGTMGRKVARRRKEPKSYLSPYSQRSIQQARNNG